MRNKENAHIGVLTSEVVAKGDFVNRQLSELLLELRGLNDRVRHALDGLVEVTNQIHKSINRLAILRPDVTTTLVAEALLQPDIGQGVGRNPAVTLAIRLPGGLGVCVWPNRQMESNECDLPHGSGDMHFVPLGRTPPVLLRMLVPNLESLLEALRLRVER
jgi:hypothetical protein